MNPFSEFLHEIAMAFEHLIGDPVHTQSATAVKTTLQAAAQVADTGGPEHLEALHTALEKVTGTGRATTPEEWSELHKSATIIKADAAAVTPPAMQQPQQNTPAPRTPEVPNSAS